MGGKFRAYSPVQFLGSTSVDQVVNNAINNEINKGVGGVEQDIEGIFH